MNTSGIDLKIAKYINDCSVDMNIANNGSSVNIKILNKELNKLV